MNLASATTDEVHQGQGWTERPRTAALEGRVQRIEEYNAWMVLKEVLCEEYNDRTTIKGLPISHYAS